MTMYHYCEIVYRRDSFLMKQMGKAGLSGLPLGSLDKLVIDMHDLLPGPQREGLFWQEESLSGPNA